MCCVRDQRGLMVSGSTELCWAAAGHSPNLLSLKSSWEEAEVERLRSWVKDRISGHTSVKGLVR